MELIGLNVGSVESIGLNVGLNDGIKVGCNVGDSVGDPTSEKKVLRPTVYLC